jgi:1-acyl-sn-glycerol-3-phosphate acyltransferase
MEASGNGQGAMLPGVPHTVGSVPADAPMLLALPLPLRAPLLVAIIALSTVAHVVVLMAAALGKALAPARTLRDWNLRLVRIAESWIGVNSAMIRQGTRTRFELDLPDGLRREASYLVLSNHQSWVDIPVLQHVFNRRIPLLRFFLKQELIWVPLLGVAWWALDFPFMKRYSKEHLARHPELAGTDIDATRRACEKFRHTPVSVMNFVEGTRFTAEKHARGSPYRHLLRPKAGGVAFVLDAMGSALHGVLDVTLVYPGGKPTVWDLFCNRIPLVRLHVRELAVPAVAIGADYESDPEFRARFQAWINTLWAEKDERIAQMLPDPAP